MHQEEMLQLKPSEIRYSQDSIRCVFTGLHWGKEIGETLDELVDGDIIVDDIPKISVIFRNGKWFTYDNRRLWVLKHFELLGGCIQIYVTQTTYLDWRKFTTYNEGTSIRVRGDPGGTWYHKYTRNPEKYKNYLRNRNINPNNESCATGYASSFRSGFLTSHLQSSLRSQAQNDFRYDNEQTSVRKVTNTSVALYDSQQQPLFGYHRNEYTDKMFSDTTSFTAKTMFNNSSSSFSQDPISRPSSSIRKETPSIIAKQPPSAASSYQNYYQSTSEISLKDIRPVSTLSSSEIGTRNYPLPTDRTQESSLRDTKQTLCLSSSNSSVTKNYVVPSKRGGSLSTERNSEHVTSCTDSKTESKRCVYPALSVSNHVQYQDKNNESNISRPIVTTESSLTATKTTKVARTKYKKSVCVLL